MAELLSAVLSATNCAERSAGCLVRHTSYTACTAHADIVWAADHLCCYGMHVRERVVLDQKHHAAQQDHTLLTGCTCDITTDKDKSQLTVRHSLLVAYLE